jgi:hypothetical protein
VTERKSAVDPLVDFLLYAPVGAALLAQEELPKLIAKGRNRLGGQVAVARFMSQMALRQGRSEADKVIRQVEGILVGLGVVPGPAQTAAPDKSPGTQNQGPPAPGQTGPLHAVPDQPGSARGAANGSTGPVDIAQAPTRRHLGEPAGGPPRTGPPRTGPARMARVTPANPKAHSAEPGADSGNLAIPGYDSLSASQVLPRLSGLTPAELEAVRNYELATRGRRTILSKVAQLQQQSSA